MKIYFIWQQIVDFAFLSTLGCANKDLDGYFGPLGKFIDYCKTTALLPVIPLGIRVDCLFDYWFFNK